MEYRVLGASGFKVPVLSLGTGTFGGGGEFFKAWGATDVAEATRLVDVSLEAGLNMFDSADIYSNGTAEEILGQAIKGRRDQVIISTKGTFRAGTGPNDVTLTQQADWKKWARAMSDAGLAAFKASQNKDFKALVAANSQLVETCEGCHKQYKPALPSEGIIHQHLHVEQH